MYAVLHQLMFSLTIHTGKVKAAHLTKTFRSPYKQRRFDDDKAKGHDTDAGPDPGVAGKVRILRTFSSSHSSPVPPSPQWIHRPGKIVAIQFFLFKWPNSAFDK